MYNDKPKAIMPALLLILAALFAVLWSRTPDDGKLMTGIKLVFSVAAIFLAIVGLCELFQYIGDFIAYAKSEIARADFRLMYANSLHGLPDGARDHITRTAGLEMFGILDDQLNVSWRLRSPKGIADPDLGFIQTFIMASEDSWPYLWPTNQAYNLGDYPNAERQATAFTDALYVAGILAQSKGKYTARVKDGISYDDVAKMFGVEHDPLGLVRPLEEHQKPDNSCRSLSTPDHQQNRFRSISGRGRWVGD